MTDSSRRPINPVKELATERWVSGLLAGLCRATAVLLPLATAWYWITVSPEALAAALAPGQPVPRVFPYGVADWQRLAGAAVSLAGVAVLVHGLMGIRSCFLLFRDGRFFDPTAVRGIRRFAAAVFAAAFIRLLTTPLLSALMTMHNSPGDRFITVGIGSDELFSLLIAAAFWVVASLLARAGDIAKENAQFV